MKCALHKNKDQLRQTSWPTVTFDSTYRLIMTFWSLFVVVVFNKDATKTITNDESTWMNLLGQLRSRHEQELLQCRAVKLKLPWGRDYK